MTALPLRSPGRKYALPLSGLFLGVLCLAYMLLGLFGRDPWKTEDAVGFGIIYHFIQTGDWLIPQLAGEPLLEEPPLYYWVGTILARALHFALDFPDAARLATALFLWITIWCVHRTGQELKLQIGPAAVTLLFMGSLGLLVQAHQTGPGIAHLAGVAAMFYGAALIPRQTWRAAILIGAGMGTAFMAQGLPILLFGLALFLALPLFAAELRNRRYIKACLLSLLIAAPFICLWPSALYAKSPTFFASWWSWNVSEIGGTYFLSTLWKRLNMLIWFAWPSWPLALWAVWKFRKELSKQALVLPLFFFAALLVVQSLSDSPAERQLLPLLPPLAVLGAVALPTLRRGAAAAFDWFGIMTFTFFAALIWLGWIAMQSGWPPTIAHNFAKLEPGFLPQFQLFPFLIAALLSLAWIYMAWPRKRNAHRGPTHWAAGITLILGLTMTLLLPWIDYGKSYRHLAGIKRHVNSPSCVASVGLGEPQRASLHYFLGLKTQRVEARSRTQTDDKMPDGSDTGKRTR